MKNSGGVLEVDINEALTFAGIFVGGLIAGLMGYYRTKKPGGGTRDSVLTSVGVELGSKFQMDEVIKALNRIADAIEGKRTTGMENMLRDLLQRVDGKEH